MAETTTPRKWLDPATIIQTVLFLAAGVPAAFHLFEKIDSTADKAEVVARQVEKITEVMQQHTTTIGQTNIKLDQMAETQHENSKCITELKNNMAVLLDRTNTKTAGPGAN